MKVRHRRSLGTAPENLKRSNRSVFEFRRSESDTTPVALCAKLYSKLKPTEECRDSLEQRGFTATLSPSVRETT
jgi:hypothetical protein